VIESLVERRRNKSLGKRERSPELDNPEMGTPESIAK
jgi:hypothetical protein